MVHSQYTMCRHEGEPSTGRKKSGRNIAVDFFEVNPSGEQQEPSGSNSQPAMGASRIPLPLVWVECQINTELPMLDFHTFICIMVKNNFLEKRINEYN